MQTSRHAHIPKPKVSASRRCFHSTKWHWMLEEVQINLLSHQLLFHWWSGSHFTAKQLREAALKYFGIWVKTQSVFLESSSSSRRAFSTHGEGLNERKCLAVCVRDSRVSLRAHFVFVENAGAHHCGFTKFPFTACVLGAVPALLLYLRIPSYQTFSNWTKCSFKIILRCQFSFSGLS